MRFKSNYNSPSKLEGIARSVGGWIKYPSVPQRGEHSALCDGDRRFPAGGGRVSIKVSFSHRHKASIFTHSSGLKATSPNLGEE